MAEESKYITKKKPEYITKKKPEYITKKKPQYITKKKKLNEPLAEVYGQVADRSRKRLQERGNIKIEDLMDKGKKDIEEAAKSMGAYKGGGRVCKLATKGKGRAYGKNS